MIALLDTGFSNLKAYANLLVYLNKEFEIISDGEELNADHHRCILLPGVSNFGTLIEELHKRAFTQKLIQFVNNGTRLVGTCSGMQVLFSNSEESSNVPGLNIINGDVRKFPVQKKVDINIGWKETSRGNYFFVHGFYCTSESEFEQVDYSTFNGVKFISEFRCGNVY